MKRLGSSDSLGALISICPSTEKKNPGSSHHGYSKGFQSMLDSFDEEDCMEESGHVAEKKRRLSVLQVKALEKNFEVENKLEPERKVKLAQELGLQPRQVAVWFQNRRARWKTKQLERDYGILHASYEDLKLKFDVLQHDKETLLAEVRELKLKLQEENTESKISIKEEVLISESEDKSTKISSTPNYESHNNDNGERNSVFLDFKDGFSDSDSSAIVSEETSPNADDLLISPPSSSFSFNFYSSSNCFPFSDSKFVSMNNQKGYQHQFVKTEEHNFFSLEEPCNFFSEEQAPTLQW